MTRRRPLLPYLFGPALPLLVPLAAMRFTDEVRWSPLDFAVAYVLLAATGLTYRVVTEHGGRTVFRQAAALAVFGCLTLIWINLAVGFIGDEDNPANLLYGGVPLLGVIGAVASNFAARGLARTLFAMAAWQLLVPVVAWLGWRASFGDDAVLLFLLNGVWVGIFVAAALLFRRAAQD